MTEVHEVEARVVALSLMVCEMVARIGADWPDPAREVQAMRRQAAGRAAELRVTLSPKTFSAIDAAFEEIAEDMIMALTRSG